MLMKKAAYTILLAGFIAASVLIFESKETVDTTMKPLLEGLTVGLTILTLGGLGMLFRDGAIKNHILFNMINVILCALSVVTLIGCLRDSGFDRNAAVNVGFIALLAISVGITGFFMLDGTMELGAALGKEVVTKGKRK